MPHNGNYIPCLLVQRLDGSRIWWPKLDYEANPPAGSFAYTHVFKPRRQEVTREYKTVPVPVDLHQQIGEHLYGGMKSGGKKFRVFNTHYRLEEI